MNRVLSMRPWKIGTPISMHFSMTSRRSMPASRASSVGVRWIAIRPMPPVRFATWPATVARETDVINNNSSIRAKHWPLDGVRDVDPDVLDPEPLGQPVAQRADAERLRRVVAGGDEVDARLARVGHRVLARLAGQQRVEPERDRLR